MTLYLALDTINAQHPLPDGRIVAISDTEQGIRDLGLTAALGYSNDRLRTIDETSADWDEDCLVLWYYVHTATPKVQADQPQTTLEADTATVAADIASFQDAVLREAQDWEEVLAREHFAPHTDSGHAWSDDLLHALIKPNIRGLVVLLEAAKASPSQTTITAYRDRLDSFVSIADDPGVIDIYRNADKSVWRPLRVGAHAYGYDTTDGGIRQYDSDNDNVPDTDIAFPVSYPTGESVATWDALSEVEAL